MWSDRLVFASCVLIALAAVVFALTSGDSYLVSVLIWVATNALLAATLRFVLLIGELNLGTAAFFGIGAYAAGIATTMLQAPFLVALLAGVLAAAAVSAVFGYVTLRVKGPYFLLIAFAFTEVVRLIYTQTSAIGGNSGMIGIFPPIWMDPYFAALMIAIIALVLFGLYGVEQGALGRIFKAIENNENIPRSVGINVLGVKILCLVLASAAAGLGGALHAHSNNVISPGDFSFLLAVFALAYVKIGGQRHILGAVLGAAVLTTLGQFALRFGTHEHVFYGAAIIFAMLVMPNGLLGLFDRVQQFVAQRLSPGSVPAQGKVP
jgi:branched-chain amino acid transport system permease protein